jgi:cytochrome oxidase Cu insertion factor (SCO1/SenC/PrrC family)
MPEASYIPLKTIFVSVDPDRDTPQNIDEFLGLFDKSFIGVTAESNDSPRLKEIMNAFRIYASKIEY